METPKSNWTEKQKKRFKALSLDEWVYIRDTVKNWPLWRDTPHALLVHAGLEPGKTRLEDMSPEVLLSIRYWNDKPWFEQVKWNKLVIFGHWAKMGFVNIPGFIGLDSGCVYGKALTAWCPEEDKFYSVPALRNPKQPPAKCSATTLPIPCHPRRSTKSRNGLQVATSPARKRLPKNRTSARQAPPSALNGPGINLLSFN